MLIPPKYTLTLKITQLLQEIEINKAVINSLNITKEIELNLRRQSSLKSSLFSAKIEGNTLRLEELTKLSTKDQRKIEVFNILKALNLIYSNKTKTITSKDILTFHKIVMANLVDKKELGHFRKEAGAIFNTAGVVVYLPPRPSQVLFLINNLIKFINSKKEPFVIVKAALVHFSFEKIHPFLDGNGRVGRLLLQAILQKENYGMKGLLNLEEYLDQERSDYYRFLENSEKDVTEYLEFMLECMAKAADEAKNKILLAQNGSGKDLLLPRREEILNIIKDHGMVNFDIIRRRFLGVNERTLRYDLKKLADGGFVKKRGTTKGVYYEAS